MAMNIDQLKAIINDPESSPENIALAKDMLKTEEERLASIGGARLQLMAGQGEADEQLAAILSVLEGALQGGKGTPLNMADLRKAVNEELAKRKINMSDLSPDVLNFLNSQRAVTFTLKMMSISKSTDTSGEFLSRPLTQMLLSDVMARNNVYLYGGAGTGKTFYANMMAKMLGWNLITVNCNQFTSPLDLIGGQTIDGYQEGKVSMAWSNEISYPDGRKEKVDGCVLLLDELPKIDPNTAGILNEALAKTKDFIENKGTLIRPTIQNGRNEVLPLGNLFVIATGNVKLNTIDPDYEANFKQDLSLQDRFIGSTYEVTVDYESEWNTVGKGFTFIWLYLVKVREKIKEIRATNQAFVSIRLMQSVRATYVVYREVKNKIKKQKGQITNEAITEPKTIIDAMDNFFNLFKENPRKTLIETTDYAGFKKLVAEKNKLPYDPSAPDFDTPMEVEEAMRLIAKNKEERKKMFS